MVTREYLSMALDSASMGEAARVSACVRACVRVCVWLKLNLPTSSALISSSAFSSTSVKRSTTCR
jgi:hypothetical protein